MLKKLLATAVFSALGFMAASAHAAPEVSPTMKAMLGALPLNELRGDVQKMVGTLKETSCGGGLSGC